MVPSKAFHCLFLSEKNIYVCLCLLVSTNAVSEQTFLWSEIKAGMVLRSRVWHLCFDVPTSLGTSLGSSFLLLAPRCLPNAQLSKLLTREKIFFFFPLLPLGSVFAHPEQIPQQAAAAQVSQTPQHGGAAGARGRTGGISTRLAPRTEARALPKCIRRAPRAFCAVLRASCCQSCPRSYQANSSDSFIKHPEYSEVINNIHGSPRPISCTTTALERSCKTRTQ